MAYDQRQRVLRQLSGLGSDFELLSLDIIDESVAEANRMVQHHYTHNNGTDVGIAMSAAQQEAILTPANDLGVPTHINEITGVSHIRASPSQINSVPIIDYASVKWMQNTEGQVGNNLIVRVCGIRKRRVTAGTHDTGDIGSMGWDGGFWGIACYPRTNGTLVLKLSLQAWDGNFDNTVRDNDQKIFMLEEAVRIACATLAPKIGLKPPQIDTLLSQTPEWAHTAMQQIHSSLYPWAGNEQEAVMG